MNKRKKRSSKPPHRYFFREGHGVIQTKIVVFKNGIDGLGQSVFDDGSVAVQNWWSFDEMNRIGAIEISAKLIKKVARL